MKGTLLGLHYTLLKYTITELWQ